MADSLFDVAGKVVVVTGAGSGIGQGIAIGLAQRGALVTGWDRVASGLEETRGKAGSAAFGAEVVDVTDEAVVKAGMAAVQRRRGCIDVVFVNAGIAGRPIPLADLDLAEWRSVHAVNLDGAFLVAREAARWMMPQGAGKIVFTASTWGVRGTDVAPFTAYASSKGAVVNLTRQLALECAPFGVTVNSIAPGGFATNMANGVLDQAASDALLADIPLKKFVSPDAMVGTAVYLASAASDWVTGALLPVDGGYLAK